MGFEETRLPKLLLRPIMYIYEGFTIRLIGADRLSKKMELSVGVHQESPLSSLLLIIVMEQVTRECSK